MNGTKIRQRLAFQYGIYAVKRGIYPFVTPESGRSDMRARVEAKMWKGGKSSTSMSQASSQR